MYSLLFFIIAIAILVVVHEFGHFWVARRCGVKVLKFSVGFGPALWQHVAKDGTEYAVSAIPLGGFVKMLDEREAEVEPGQLTHAFNRKPLLSRVAIVAAGPIANLLFAVFAYWFVFVVGVTGLKPVISDVATASIAEQAGLESGDHIVAVNGVETVIWNQVVKQLLLASEQVDNVALTIKRGTSSYETTFDIAPKSPEKSTNLLSTVGIQPLFPELQPVIGQVVSGGVAERAGLVAGDKLVSADGIKLTNWSAWVEYIQNNPEHEFIVEFERDAQHKQLSLSPNKNEQGQGYIGIGVDQSATTIPTSYFAKVQLTPINAVKEAVVETWQFSILTVQGIWGMLTGAISLDNVGGPISIAQIAGASAENGMVAFLQMLAIISISLGILNLLPIPVLDGGHLVFYAVEAIKGSPLSIEAQMMAQKIGIILLLSLMLLAFFNDLTRLFG